MMSFASTILSCSYLLRVAQFFIEFFFLPFLTPSAIGNELLPQVIPVAITGVAIPSWLAVPTIAIPTIEVRFFVLR